MSTHSFGSTLLGCWFVLTAPTLRNFSRTFYCIHSTRNLMPNLPTPDRWKKLLPAEFSRASCTFTISLEPHLRLGCRNKWFRRMQGATFFFLLQALSELILSPVAYEQSVTANSHLPQKRRMQGAKGFSPDLQVLAVALDDSSCPAGGKQAWL